MTVTADAAVPLGEDQSLQLVRELLDAAIAHNVSDIHLTAGSRPSMRRAGDLRFTNAQWPELPDHAVYEIAGYLARNFLSRGRQDVDIRPLSPRELQDHDGAIDTSCYHEGKSGARRLRVNIFSQQGHPAIAVRLLPPEVPAFEQLGLPLEIKNLTNETSGLIVVSGPTGSGKSTTLAALLGEINLHRRCHIITIEDPVEYVFRDGTALVHQREIGLDAPDFAKALRYILRQDPDVVMVGEMRDQESISSTVTAAETGHLVLSTLHAEDAKGVISRIIDIYHPEQQGQIRAQLAATLRAVICQRLLTSAEHEGAAVVVAEVMFINTAIRNLIRQNKLEQIPNQILSGNGVGMRLFDQALANAVADGRVDKKQALMYVRTEQQYQQYLARAASASPVFSSPSS